MTRLPEDERLALPPDDTELTARADESGDPVLKERPRGWKRWLRHAPHLLGLLLMIAAIVVVRRELHSLSMADIRAALASIPDTALLAGVGCTFLSYFILSFYDRLAVIQVGHPQISWLRTAFAAFCSYVLSHNLGFSAVSGAAVRFRLYRNWGLPPFAIAHIIAFCSVTYLLGAAVLIGSVLLIEPGAVPGPGGHVPTPVVAGVGIALWLGVLAYILAGLKWREFTFRGKTVELPSAPMAIAQTVVSAADMAATAAIAWVLLPPDTVDYPSFLAIYIASYTAGLVASVPGGLGVFDSAMLLALGPYMPKAQIIGVILVFRLFYYIVPLFLAGGMFAAHELFLRGDAVLARKKGKSCESDEVRERRPSLAVRESEADFSVGVSTGTVSMCGVLLMILPLINPIVVPDGASRVTVLAAHYVGDYVLTLVGAVLIALAVGLSQRVTLAWGATLSLLVASAALTFLRGNALPVPAVLAFSAFLIAPFRRCYYRHARLLSEPLSFSTLLSLLLLIGCAVVIATHREGADGWWDLLVPEGSHARWVMLLAVLLSVVVIARLARPGRVVVRSWNDKTANWYHAHDHALPRLPGTVVDGVVAGEAGTAVLPFRRRGMLLVGLGDPAGDDVDCASAIWRLRDLAMQEGLQPVFWRTGATFLPIYADIGLVAWPLADGPGSYVCCPSEQIGLVRAVLVGRK
ncbi:transporter [Acetobacter estunensis NRIC 0472]|uniref:Lysylphosphatidylglycerol synthetase family protein n=2 Tax=Acetobacter estunensis TaxID=104097 RepID=A0A967EC33_9PROT|nr:lysylphosphatidylglycerol synthase domain-containing protein [Acetobacter estunensis]NHO52510.1 lysylphosphatidylglycerol synthetase family protein [Acetobacter estunensis]GBQ26181.1 transporter [Acetobacter estunensis NRIC 0472]